MNSPKPIENSDIAILEKTLIDLINKFPELPEQIKKDGIIFQDSKPKNISLTLASIPSNSVIEDTWICGSYFAKYEFRLLLQKMSITNSERINSHDILGKLAQWLEKTPIKKEDGTVYRLEEYPPLERNMNITKIERISHVRLIERTPPNIEIHEARLKLKYFVKKSLF